MCSGGGGGVPLDKRPDDQLQKIITNADKHPGYVDVWKKGQRSRVPYNPYAFQAIEAKKILEQRNAQRAELQRITEERTRLMENQQTEMQRLQQAQVEAAANQERTVADLRLQEQQQEEELTMARMATQAAAASMRVLQARATTGTAPTAQSSRPAQEQRRRASTGSSLRIGQTAAAPGVGINIGG